MVHLVYVVRYFVFLCVTCLRVCNSRSYLYMHMNMFFIMFFFFACEGGGAVNHQQRFLLFLLLAPVSSTFPHVAA